MNKQLDSRVDRRTILTAAALGGTYLLAPIKLYAQDSTHQKSEEVEYFFDPDLTDEDYERLLLEQSELEAEKIIKEATENRGISPRANGRPTYTTVYGRLVTKETGWHDIAGQPPGGVQIAGSGTIHVARTGGGSVGVSVSLPGGLGGLSVSLPLSRQSFFVTGYSVNISGNGFYKATANISYKVHPFVVYEKKNGKSRVYAKTASCVFYRLALSKRRIY